MEKIIIEYFSETPISLAIALVMFLYGCAMLFKKVYGWFKVLFKMETKKDFIYSTVESNKDDIEALKNDFADIKSILLGHIKKDKAYKIRSISDKIFSCYQTMMKQGYSTSVQLQNFDENVEEFDRLGGTTHVVHEKYVKEVYSLPVYKFEDTVREDFKHEKNSKKRY